MLRSPPSRHTIFLHLVPKTHTSLSRNGQENDTRFICVLPPGFGRGGPRAHSFREDRHYRRRSVPHADTCAWPQCSESGWAVLWVSVHFCSASYAPLTRLLSQTGSAGLKAAEADPSSSMTGGAANLATARPAASAMNNQANAPAASPDQVTVSWPRPEPWTY